MADKDTDDLQKELLKEQLRERQEASEEKKKEQLEKWYKEGEEDREKNFKKSFKGKLAQGISSLSNQISEDLKSGDLKKIFLIPFKLPFKLLGLLIELKKFWLLIIILIAALAWLTVTNFLLGGGVSILGTQTSILGSQISGPISTALTTAKNFVFDPVGTVASYGTFKNPQTIEKSKQQGIEFKNFRTRREIHRETDKIETIANVKVYSLEDSSTTVDFYCSISDPVSLYNDVEATKLTITGQEESANSITIFKNQDKNFNILCEFPPQDAGAFNFGENINREKTLTQKVTLKANYKDFVVNSRLKVYILDKEIYSTLEKENLNPFNHFKINDPLISSDKSVRSEQLKKGPVVLSLTVLGEQPLTESGFYLLGVQLFNDKLSWNGKLAKLSNLKLTFPENFNVDLEDCNDFENDKNKKGVFILKKQLEKIPDKLELFCSFSIDSLDDKSLTFSLINAEAKFDYEFEAYTTATISTSLLRSTIT